MTLTFACGHRGDHSETSDVSPKCPQCGEVRVMHVQARPPRFRGAVRGPYAETAHVDPAVVNLAPAGALTLKEQ